VSVRRRSRASFAVSGDGGSVGRSSAAHRRRRQSGATTGSVGRASSGTRTGRRQSVASRRLSVGQLSFGSAARRGSVASAGSTGSSGTKILGGGGLPEANWQRALKISVANIFYPPVHAGMGGVGVDVAMVHLTCVCVKALTLSLSLSHSFNLCLSHSHSHCPRHAFVPRRR
jgi:hypothetical protein